MATAGSSRNARCATATQSRADSSREPQLATRCASRGPRGIQTFTLSLARQLAVASRQQSRRQAARRMGVALASCSRNVQTSGSTPSRADSSRDCKLAAARLLRLSRAVARPDLPPARNRESQAVAMGSWRKGGRCDSRLPSHRPPFRQLAIARQQESQGQAARRVGVATAASSRNAHHTGSPQSRAGDSHDG